MPSAVRLFIHSTTIERLLCARDTAGKAAVTGMMSIYREQRAYVTGSALVKGSEMSGCLSEQKQQLFRPRSWVECERQCLEGPEVRQELDLAGL